MHVAVACGGTGGHIFPGIVTAEALKRRGHRVSLWLSGRDIEGVSVENWTGKIVRISAAGFQSGFSALYFGVVVKLVAAFFKSKANMKQDRPDVLLAMGSYASVGPVIAAWTLGIPIVLHEANAAPGRAISFLSRYASAVAVTFAKTAEWLKHKKIVATGFPLRADMQGEFEKGLLAENVFTVLVMGGSQGAHALNTAVSSALCGVNSRGKRAQVIHLTGKNDEETVRQKYKEAGVSALVFGFLKEMGKAYRAANFAISRAGAASCMELSANGIPALLVPLPSARRNHQMENARVLAATGGADIVAESDMSGTWLEDYLSRCIEDRARLDRMGRAIKTIAVSNGAERLANLVLEQAVGSSPP